MKKILVASLLAGMLLITGCNDSDDVPIREAGDPLVVNQVVEMECDVPFAFRSYGLAWSSALGVREGYQDVQTLQYEIDEELIPEDGTTIYHDRDGIDIKFVVITPCEDKNISKDPKEPIVAVDGVCPDGYEVSNCDASKCVAVLTEPVEPIICGEGTVLDDNNTCIPTPPVECGEGLVADPETGLCGIAPEEEHPCGEDTEWNEETELCEIVIVG